MAAAVYKEGFLSHLIQVKGGLWPFTLKVVRVFHHLHLLQLLCSNKTCYVMDSSSYSGEDVLLLSTQIIAVRAEVSSQVWNSGVRTVEQH